MSEIGKWAEATGLSKIKDGPGEDKLEWAMDILSGKPHKISSMDPDELCDLLMIANAWHLYLRKELGQQRALLKQIEREFDATCSMKADKNLHPVDGKLRASLTDPTILKMKNTLNTRRMKVESLSEICYALRDQIGSLKSVYINNKIAKRGGGFGA